MLDAGFNLLLCVTDVLEDILSENNFLRMLHSFTSKAGSLVSQKYQLQYLFVLLSLFQT